MVREDPHESLGLGERVAPSHIEHNLRLSGDPYVPDHHLHLTPRLETTEDIHSRAPTAAPGIATVTIPISPNGIEWESYLPTDPATLAGYFRGKEGP